MPTSTLQGLQDSLSRLERRLDALAEEAAVSVRQTEELRMILNRAVDRVRELEGSLAKLDPKFKGR